MASLGNDLVIDLGVDSRGVGKGFNSARRELNGFKRDVGGFNRSTKTAQRGLLELSRGVEDFAVSFGTSGFSGGLRGAANNLSQLAFIMGGPLVGAIAGLSIAGLSMWQAFNKDAEKAKETVKEVKRSVEDMTKSLNKSRQFDKDVLAQRAAGGENVNSSRVIREQIVREKRRLENTRREAREQLPVNRNPDVIGPKMKERIEEFEVKIQDSKRALEDLNQQLREAIASEKRDKRLSEKSDRERGIAANDRLQARFKQRRQNLENEAEGFRRAFRSPLENLKSKLQDIDRLAKRGFLKPNEAARAENQVIDAFRKSELAKQKPDKPLKLPGLATQGSAEAARALARFRASGLVKNTKQNPNKNLEAINKQVLAVLKEIQIGLQEDEDQVVNVFGE